ncbi:TPA: hypothetical protein VDU30_002136 [Pseudomonas aeruginosa]|nr:hypothetical protein [Pseudomonas aeruginosa]HEP8642553.1 hypothetical protein [Pseudomonas aeruginosa]
MNDSYRPATGLHLDSDRKPAHRVDDRCPGITVGGKPPAKAVLAGRPFKERIWGRWRVFGVKLEQHVLVVAPNCIHVGLREEPGAPVRAWATIDEISDDKQPIMRRLELNLAHRLQDQVVGAMDIAADEVTTGRINCHALHQAWLFLELAAHRGLSGILDMVQRFQ